MINQAVKEPICQSVKSSQALPAHRMANAEGPISPVTIIVYILFKIIFRTLRIILGFNDEIRTFLSKFRLFLGY